MPNAFDILSPEIQSVVLQYEAREENELQLASTLSVPERMAHRDEMLLSVGRGTALLMNLLVKELRAKAILEVGTSYGYSTVWLAEAAASTGGRVTTIELQSNKAEYARVQLDKARLCAWVDFRVGDALSVLRELNGPFDFVLLDLWKELYIPSFDLTYTMLSPGAVLVADNMLQPEVLRPQADAYRKHVHTKPDMSSILLPVGSGIEISRYR